MVSRETTGSRPAWAIAAAFATSAIGCASILDIDGAQRDPLLLSDAGSGADGGAAGSKGDQPDAQTTLCDRYCDAIELGCSGESSVYASRGVCERVCMALPAGNAGDESGNTVLCRLRNAELARQTGEPATHCPIAGPGGNGTCGTNCEGYCTIMASACGPRFDERFATFAGCMAACQDGPEDLGTYGVSVPMQAGDSVQCRLYHVSAATADPDTHCPHASGEPPCVPLR